MTPASKSRALPSGWKAWTRQTHRWVSILFTATVAANFVVLAFGEPPLWLNLLPLPPLAFLIVTGLTLFALPYVAGRSRAARQE